MKFQDIQNSACRNCGLYRDCKTVCNMSEEVPKQGGMMVVGDYPAESDDIAGTIMRSRKEEIFWTVANEVVRVDEEYMYVTYTTKCKPRTGQRPSEKDNMLCASTYLRQEILALKPKSILLMGAAAMAAFGFNDSVSKVRGTKKEITIGKGEHRHTTTLVIAQSPGYVMYNSAELKNFAMDMNTAWMIATGTLPDNELPTRVVMCTTLEQVEELIGYVHQTGQCVFDFENNKLTDMGTFDPDFKVTLLAVSFQHGSAYTIPLFHFDSPFSEEEVMHILQRFSDEIWSNPDIHKINQNIKYDMHVADRYGFGTFRGRLDCTMIMHSLYDDLSKHGIKEWLPTFFPEFMEWELIVKGNAWDKVPLKQLSDYGGIDADGAFRGFTVLQQKLMEDERVYDLYRNLSMFALRPLYNMERRGMLLSREKILEYEKRALDLMQQQIDKMNKYVQVHKFCSLERQRIVGDKLEELRDKRSRAKGKNLEKYKQLIREVKTGMLQVYKGINFGSPDQLGELLYNKEGFGFKIPYDRKTKTYKKITGSDIIKALGDKTGFVHDLLVFRSIKTTWSRYLKGLRLLMDANDRAHTTYNQAVVKTGRLSSSDPNMQNITTHVKIKHPFVEEVTALPKKAFVVPEGYVLANVDFSQAELRMIAELANETNMIAAYNNNEDVHKTTASAIMGLTKEQFLQLAEKEIKEARQKGKAANFGLIFLQSPEGFQEYAKNAYGVDITLEEATKIHSAFFELYPRISDYHSIYIAKGKKFGYVRTLFGRRGHYPDINSLDSFKRGNAERELVNMPVQGSNGENTVFALALLEYRLPSSVLLYNTVHDSIMMLIPYKLVPYAIKVAKDTCVNLPTKRFFGKEMVHLKMAVDVEITITNWRELKPYNEEEWLALGLK